MFIFYEDGTNHKLIAKQLKVKKRKECFLQWISQRTVCFYFSCGWGSLFIETGDGNIFFIH